VLELVIVVCTLCGGLAEERRIGARPCVHKRHCCVKARAALQGRWLP
jgi:hypothetical protein